MNIIAKQIRRSFALRLSLMIVAIATVVFIVAIGELFHRSRTALRQAAVAQATQVLSNTMQHMTALLSEVEVATDNTDWLVLENLQPDALLTISRDMVELNPILDGCSIALEAYFFKDQGKFFSAYSSRRDEGHIETEQEGNESYFYFGMDWYSLPMQRGKALWIDPFPDSNDITGNNRGLIISYCKPLVTAEGRTIGVISTDISLRKLTQELSKERLFPESYFILSDSRDKIIASTNGDITQEASIDYDHNLVIANQIPHTDWKLTIVCPKNDIFKGYYQLIYIVITIVIFGLLLLWVFCYFVVRSNVARLQMLATTTQDMAKGRFDTPIPQTRRKDDTPFLY